MYAKAGQVSPLATPPAPVISLPFLWSNVLDFAFFVHSSGGYWVMASNEPGPSAFWLNINPVQSNQRVSLVGNKDDARKESRFPISSPAVFVDARIHWAFFQKGQHVKSQNKVEGQLADYINSLAVFSHLNLCRKEIRLWSTRTPNDLPHRTHKACLVQPLQPVR